jgi:hypothetical protein
MDVEHVMSASESENPTNATWGQRHGLTLLVVIMGACLALVITIQMLD